MWLVPQWIGGTMGCKGGGGEDGSESGKTSKKTVGSSKHAEVTFVGQYSEIIRTKLS